MTVPAEVQAYIDRQPSYRWRRKIMQAIGGFISFKIMWRMKFNGMANIPASGPVIIMINHTASPDPVVCMAGIKPRYVIPMTKAENLDSPLMRFLVNFWGAYPVKRGEIDRKALMNSIELLKAGQMILIAPEGTRSGGLQEAKDGLTYIATKSDAVVVPTGISGAIGWKENLKAFKRTSISVNFGKPFKFKTGGERVPRDVMAAMSHEAMYQLALAVEDPALRGVYSDLSKVTTEHIEFV